MHTYKLDLESGELYHWGIKGMRWGIRRYQNEDGSLTPEGRIRYGREMARLDKKAMKIAKKKSDLAIREERQKAKIEIRKKKKTGKSLAKEAAFIALDKYKKNHKDGTNTDNTYNNSTKKNKGKNKSNSSVKVNIEKGNNGVKVKKDNSNSTIGFNQYKQASYIVEHNEQRTHKGIDRLYKDKYVMNGQTAMRTKKFKQMDTQDLNRYIDRLESENRYLGAVEKRAYYDTNSRTLKRVTSHVASAVVLAIGVVAVKNILSKGKS